MKGSVSTSFILFAIVLPAVTFGVEFTTGFCANNILDPIPRWPLIIGVGLVPVIFLLHALKQSGGLDFMRRPLVNFLVAATVPLSAYYCITFGALLVMGAFALMAFGLGLLPLTPLFTFCFGLKAIANDQVKSWNRSHFGGLLFGIVFVLVAEVPSWVTYSQIYRIAEDDSPETVESAVKICDWFGSEKSAFLQSTSSGGRAAEPVEFFFTWTNLLNNEVSWKEKEAAELLYYYMSGKTLNLSGYTKRFGKRRENWNPDALHGGDTVGLLQPGLKLQHSILSSKIESAAGLIYQEWTVELRNTNPVDREGRALIKLPKGSVVSRLTLWVNGEPREAAFAKKEKVTEAYRKVAVQQRRDPVLVRWAGPDRIFVQCFPVPRNGGTLKYRIGFISSLDEDNEILPPRILEHNFSIAKGFDHTVRYQSDGELVSLSDDLDVVPHPKDGNVLLGQLRHRDLLADRSVGTASTQPGPVWTKDELDPQKRILIRNPAPPAKVEKRDFDVIYVVDGSSGMKKHASTVADVIRSETGNPNRTGVVIAARQGVKIFEPGDTDAMAAAVARHRYKGGIDNANGLVEAIRMADNKRKTEIIWLHGPQPIPSKNSSIVQILNRLSVNPKVNIHSFSVLEGKNYILRKLMKSPNLRNDQPADNLQNDIAAVLGNPGGSRWVWNHLDNAEAIPAGSESSNILARYWAYQKVMKELYNHSWESDDTEFASLYQLVTPFTGAVVLETRRQFIENGLKPVDPNTTTKAPAVPEPEFYLLLIATLLAALWIYRNQLFQLCQFAR